MLTRLWQAEKPDCVLVAWDTLAVPTLRQYGTLQAALADGRFAAEAEDLRLYRRIAAMDASAPLPPLATAAPTWAEASTILDSLGLGGVAVRVRALESSSTS